ncbi:MAG: hypothetical protein WAN47_02405 [Nitrosotalea sp.]
MRKKPITVATIVIFSIGIISGLLILFDYLGNPHFLSKQKAFDVAMQRSLCADNSPNELRNVGIHLLHVKNDTLFAVDERTMKDMSLAIASPFKNHENNEYVWEVTWECYFSISSEHGSQINFVGAVTGKLLE